MAEIKRQIDINDLNRINHALADVIGYLSDNSCGDPECCGGPYYEEGHFDDGVAILEEYGFTVDRATVLQPIYNG